MIDLYHLYRHTLAARASAEAAGFVATAAALRALAADIEAATAAAGGSLRPRLGACAPA